MDPGGFLSALSKMNRPIPITLVGLAMIFLSPSKWSWCGYILVAWGMGLCVDALYEVCRKTWKERQGNKQRLIAAKEEEQTVLALYNDMNPSEKYIIDHCISHNEQIFCMWDQIHYKDIISLEMKGFGEIRDRETLVIKKSYFEILRRLN